MNKNTLYIAIFGALCVLAGVLAGAVVVMKTRPAYFGFERPNFGERAERFMWHGPKELGPKPGKSEDGLFSMLVTELNLNQDQQAKVKEILHQTRQEIDKVGEGIRNNMREIKGKSDKKIMAILTAQQQEKFKELLKEFEKRGGRGLPGGPPGPRCGPGPFPDKHQSLR